MCLCFGPLALLASLDSERELNQYSLAHWDLEEGLPSNWVVNILQNEGDPALWIATPVGLARFNGVEFDIEHTIDGDLLAEGIWALGNDENGQLCVGTKNYGILVFEGSKARRIEGTESLEVRHLLLDRQDRMWIGTPGGLFVIDGGDLLSVETEDFSGCFITALYEDFASNIWIGTQDDGLFRVKPQSSLEIESVPSETTIYCIQSDAKNRIWVGGKLGLKVYENQTLQESFDAGNGLPSNTVRAMHLDTTGCLWIGTESGIVRAKDNSLIVDQNGSPFEGVFITCFYEDQEGSMWVGSKYQGFFQVWTGKFSVYADNEGLENDVVNVVYDDLDSLLVGTNSGLYQIANNQVESLYADTLGGSRIRDVVRDSKGRLWVCSYSGLYCFQENGDLRIMGVDDGLTSGLTRQILEDREGNIWVGTRAGLNRLHDGEISSWTYPELKNDLILHVFEDRAGRIWIATDGAGIAVLEAGAFRWYSTEDGLGNDVVFKIHQDLNGIYWLATANGISLFDGSNFQNIKKVDGLPSSVFFQVLEDSQGWIWITSHEGVFRIKKSSVSKFLQDKDDASLEFQRFGLVDGLRTYQMTGVGESCILKDGSICLATAKGVAILNRSELSDYLSQPDVFFEDVIVNGKELELPADRDTIHLELPPGVKRLEFKFTSTSLVSPKNTLFRTKLAGFEEDFNESGERRVTYTNLDPGDYRFVAKIRGQNGDWSESDNVIHITVDPYFKDTVWFYLMLIVPVLGMIYMLFWLRTLQMRHQREVLELKIQERTAEILDQKRTIEEKNLEIERNLRNLKNSNSELKRLSEEKSYLLGIAAHDIRNPLGNIVSLAEELLLRPEIGQSDSKAVVEMLKTSGEDLLALVQNTVQSVALENGKIELNRDNDDLVKVVDSVVAINKASADLKKQRLVMEAPESLIGFFDSLRIRTAVDNYVSNAIKYSPSQRTITIHISESEKDGERWALCKVSDQGPGLAKIDFDKVFGKFSTLSARPTGGESSTGMGLSIVKRTIESHGGSVSVENNPDQGATFSFTIPLG